MRLACLVAAIVVSGCSHPQPAPQPPTTTSVAPAQPDAGVIDEHPAVVDDRPAPPPSGKQAELAEQVNAEGVAALEAKQYATASAKFHEAAVRVPEPKYFFNLCIALYFEGKFGEAQIACRAGSANHPTPELAQKLDQQRARVEAEAKAQGLRLP